MGSIEKKVLLISTGGTIASKKVDGAVTVDDSKTAVQFREVLAKACDSFVEEYKVHAEIEPKDFFPDGHGKDSSDIDPEDWTGLAEMVAQNYDNYDSFVITHGTNTLGYTCAALTFALQGLNKPVLLTGSQVPWGFPGSDAAMNLENILRVAVQPAINFAGVYAVFGSHIIIGSRVKKTNEFEYDAFRSFNQNNSVGRIGRILRVNSGNLEAYQRFLQPTARTKADILREMKNEFDTNIISLTEFPGMSSSIFKSVVEPDDGNGVKAIILRSFGAGDPNKKIIEGLKYLREKKIPVVVTTQAPAGLASMNVNDPGRIAQEYGVIPAWDMSMECMVTKLSWLLAQGYSYQTIKAQMLQNIRGEISPND